MYFSYGRLDPGKRILAAVVEDDWSNYGLSVGTKTGGNFSSVDLAGTWNFAVYMDYLAANSPGWTVVQITLDGSGNMVSGRFTPSDNPPGELTGGQFTIDSDGFVTGFITTWADGRRLDFPCGRLDQSKSVIAAVLSEGEAGRGMIVGVRTTSADKVGIYRDGTWYLDTNGNGTWDAGTDGYIENWGGLPGDTLVVGTW